MSPCNVIAEFLIGIIDIADLYSPTGETLGEGSQGSVQTYKKVSSSKEYAVKVCRQCYCNVQWLCGGVTCSGCVEV